MRTHTERRLRRKAARAHVDALAQTFRESSEAGAQTSAESMRRQLFHLVRKNRHAAVHAVTNPEIAKISSGQTSVAHEAVRHHRRAARKALGIRVVGTHENAEGIAVWSLSARLHRFAAVYAIQNPARVGSHVDSSGRAVGTTAVRYHVQARRVARRIPLDAMNIMDADGTTVSQLVDDLA